MKNFIRENLYHLFKPVDIASIVYYRILFGALMIHSMLKIFYTGKIQRYWLGPDFNFTYYGFHWVEPLPGDGLYYLTFIMLILAIFVTIGFLYRISTFLFLLGFTYYYLLEQSLYLNHFYLTILIIFILIFIPANRLLSVDSKLNPNIKSQTAPAWTLWMLRFQMGIVYFFGGIAKLNMDWLQGEPLRMWLYKRKFYPVVGDFFTTELGVYFVSYSGLLFDLFAVPMLLWRRTRMLAIVCAFMFNLTNGILFNIGIFPFLAFGSTLLFLNPSWPRKILRLKIPKIPTIEEFKDYFVVNNKTVVTVTLIGIYAAIQILMPLRHWLYPGNPSWTEEGHKYAWHMKLRDKKGDIIYHVRDPDSNRKWTIYPSRQVLPRQYKKMSTRPNLAIQYAHYLAEEFRKKGYENVEVRAENYVSLNGRRKHLLIDPNVNLVEVHDSIFPVNWILPLDEPLKRKY